MLCSAIRARAAVLAPLALVLAACAPARTHQAATPAELADEVRVIAAAARAQREAGETLVCVARRLDGATNFNRLPTTDLARMDKHMADTVNLPNDRSATPRTLDDAAIAEAGGNVGLGPSCTGYTFLSFHRIQFRGDVAVASAWKRLSHTCSMGSALFRLQRNHETWQLVEVRHPELQSSSGCDMGRTETHPGFFSVRG